MKKILASWRAFKTELKARLKSETPVWFRRIRLVAIHFLSAGVALLGAGAVIHGFKLPEVVHAITVDVIIGSIVAVALCSTACKVPPVLDPNA